MARTFVVKWPLAPMWWILFVSDVASFSKWTEKFMMIGSRGSEIWNVSFIFASRIFV